MCEPAGPGFELTIKNADPKKAFKENQCIHTGRGGYGTREEICLQNWFMGRCGETQLANRYVPKFSFLTQYAMNKSEIKIFFTPTDHSLMDTTVCVHISTIQLSPINLLLFQRKPHATNVHCHAMPFHIHRICVWDIGKRLIQTTTPRRKHSTPSQRETIHSTRMCYRTVRIMCESDCLTNGHCSILAERKQKDDWCLMNRVEQWWNTNSVNLFWSHSFATFTRSTEIYRYNMYCSTIQQWMS